MMKLGVIKMQEEFEQWWDSLFPDIPPSTKTKELCRTAWELAWKKSRDKYLETHGNPY
jgi:hypothetical protein